jgi:uncharacterized protein (DUF885 family)
VATLDPVTLESAQKQAHFSREMLAHLDASSLDDLPHEQWLLAKILHHELVRSAETDGAYWLEFEVTPYAGGDKLHGVHAILAAQPLQTSADRKNYLHLLDAYAAMLGQIAAKTRAQAERGIRVPKPAIAGVVAMFGELQKTAPETLVPLPARLGGVPTDEAASFNEAVRERVTERIQPACAAVVAIFNDTYVQEAPEGVGISQYPGGKERYLRLITDYTGLTLTPQQIQDLGLRRVGELEERMARLRRELGFNGSREKFHEILRSDPRFLARTPEDLERRYRAYIARVSPHLTQYFAKLPKAPYEVRRLDPATEKGETWGYYAPPTPADPVGRYYYYGGADLAQRSQVWAAHLIYHELVPGHHLQLTLEMENTQAHPARRFLENGAFTEGWAEYAASLAEEMGAYADPYDLYGHLLDQLFKASRLVVDTGMNYLGMPLASARAYLKAHAIESDAEIASDTLRYSTDLYAQALCYELGYEKFWQLRHRAEKELGRRFDIRDFHAAVIGEGSMPLDVLDQHIDWFIAQRRQ